MVAACWSPATPRIGSAAPRMEASVVPKLALQLVHLGQQRARHAEQAQQIVVPRALGDVVEQRAAGVGGVGGMHAAAGEPPDEKAVDGAEGEVAGLRQRAGAGHVVEQPGDLGGGEVGIEQQAGLGGDGRLVAGILEGAAHLGGAPVLPDDGAMDGLAGAAIPDQAGLALVGDADGGDVARLQAGGGNAPGAQSPPWCARCPRDRAPPSRRPG